MKFRISKRIWWLAIVPAVAVAVIGVGYYKILMPPAEPARRTFGVAHLSPKEIQKIGYTSTYTLMMALSKPWRFPREPAAVPAPRQPSIFVEPGRWKQIAGPHQKNGWPDVRSFDIKAMASFKGTSMSAFALGGATTATISRSSSDTTARHGHMWGAMASASPGKREVRIVFRICT